MWTNVDFLIALICFYGSIKEFKIDEPFIYLYQTEVLNLTRKQIMRFAHRTSLKSIYFKRF